MLLEKVNKYVCPVIPSLVSMSMRTRAAVSIAPLAGRGGYLIGAATARARNPVIVMGMVISFFDF
jgi:hypothetical protein